MDGNDSSEVLNAWEASSQYWNKHHARIEQMFAPMTRALIDAAQIEPRHTVLDIGGGSGEPSLTITQVVGPQGLVSYTDPARGMLQTAADEARRRGIVNIQFFEAPADDLPFADNTFDVAVGRLSMMFVPNVVSGIREVLRVLKPSGRFSFLVWSRRESNPFFQIISDVLNRFVPAEPEDEDAPAAFRFSRRGKLEALVKKAGAVSVEETVVPFDITASINVDEFWELRTEMSDTFRGKLATLSAADIARMKEATTAAVAPHFQDNVMNFPSEVVIVSGNKAN